MLVRFSAVSVPVVPATILDLASFVICHRFTSPSWCSHLARHVSTDAHAWFADVMRLATGEALVFSPGALTTAGGEGEPQLLGQAALRICVRPRLTCDGGASLLAVGAALPSPPSSAGSPALSPSSPASPASVDAFDVQEPASPSPVLWYGGTTATVASIDILRQYFEAVSDVGIVQLGGSSGQQWLI